MTKNLPRTFLLRKERERESVKESARVQLGDLQNMIDVKIKMIAET